MEEKGTVLDPTASFEGKLVGSDITLRGRFKGSLQASGTLRIAEGSEIEATVTATRVEIGGTFQGQVQAGSLHVLEKGRASGTFRAKTLAVREGAQLDGELEIGEAARARAPAGAA
ncbi:MAG: polymer-forming cytoskeletal protein [Acidobacteria bacterium]|nr:polymer-forming cytoskeletal protein [Acidobacteriota bacterium]